QKEQKKKWEPPLPTRVRKKKTRGPAAAAKLPQGALGPGRTLSAICDDRVPPSPQRHGNPVPEARCFFLSFSPAGGFFLVYPNTRCRLKLLKMERIKDYLLLEDVFVQNQERLKPQEEKSQEERTKVDELRGTPMGVGTLDEIIDDDHSIVSSATGP
ncbi:MAG: hypothetical protein BJ554DRAFT_587, partial [Olpidium bornovanus]